MVAKSGLLDGALEASGAVATVAEMASTAAPAKT